MKAKIYKKGDKDFQKNVLGVSKRFKGKGGDSDSESAINAHKQDLQDGFVWFSSDNSDITNLITRSGKNIIELRDNGDSVIIKMDKKGFRSCYHAFKVAKLKRGN